jgi:hypothetical protein
LQYYTEGNVPEALIGVPETWNPDQIRQFQAYWDSINAGDTAERRHAKFVPGGVAKTFIPTREPVLKDVFDEWLARIVCFAFSIPPTAFTQQTNRATADTAQETALNEGLVPLKNWVKGLIDGVIAREFAAPDLEFAWGPDGAADPADVAKIATSYVASGIKTVNEVRGELGLAPVPGGDKAVIVTAQGPVALDGGAVASGDSKLLRFNPNHFGPGPQGGQFAPSGEGGDGGAGNPIVPASATPGQVAQEEDEDKEDNPFDPEAPARLALWNSRISTLRQIDPDNPALTYVSNPNSAPSQASLDNLNAAIQAAAIKRVADKVMPGGAWIGEEGDGPNVRIVTGGLEAARNLFDYLRVGGTVRPSRVWTHNLIQ